VPIIVTGNMQVTVKVPSENLPEYGPYDVPFDGYFRVQIPSIDQTGFYWTKNIHYTASAWAIELAIRTAAPEWTEKFEIELLNWSQYYDRKRMYVHFNNFAGNPAQWELLPALETEAGFTGESIFGPTSWELAPVFEETTVRQFNGDSLHYAPVSAEFLRTRHTQPQIMGLVDGLPVACSKVDCDFKYIEPVGLITDVTMTFQTITDDDYVDHTGYLVIITGNNLPTFWHRINIIDTLCLSPPGSVFINTSTEIFCFFQGALVAGSYVPAIMSFQGLTPLDDNFLPYEVEI